MSAQIIAIAAPVIWQIMTHRILNQLFENESMSVNMTAKVIPALKLAQLRSHAHSDTTKKIIDKPSVSTPMQAA